METVKRKDPRTGDGKASVRIDKGVMDDFKNLCNQSGSTTHDVAEDLIKKWIKDEAVKAAKVVRDKYA